MRVITDLLPSVFAVTASYTFKNSPLRFNCNLTVSRNKILRSVFSTCYTHHTDLITEFSIGEFLELYFILFYSILFL